VAAGASFDFAGNAESMGGISGAGTVILNGASVNLFAPGDRTFSGVFSGSGGVTQSGGGVFTLGGTNTYGGTTTVTSGTIRVTGPNVLPAGTLVSMSSSNPAVLDLAGFGHTLGGLSGGGPNAVVQLGAATVTLNVPTGLTRAYIGGLTGTGGVTMDVGSGTQILGGSNTYTGPTTVNAGTLRLLAGLANAGAITVANGATLEYSVPGGLTTTAGTTAVAGTFIKSGTGGLTFPAAGTFAATALPSVVAGTLTFDYAADNGAKVASGVSLGLGSGTLRVVGNGAAATADAFAGVSLTGAGKVAVTAGAGQTATLALGALTRSTGGTLDVTLGNAGAAVTTTAANGPAGIVGGYATVNGTDFASLDGTGAFAAGPQGGYTTQNAVTAWQAGQNVTNSAAFTGTLASHLTVNSLRVNAPAAATVTLGTFTRSSTYNSGGTTVTVASTTGLQPGETVTGTGIPAGTFITNITGGTTYELSAATTAAGTNATLTYGYQLTLDSGGLLVTPNVGANTTTVTGGALAATAGQNLVFQQFNTAGGLTVASGVTGTGITVVKAGPGKVTLTATNTYTGTLYLNDGSLQISTQANLGSVTAAAMTTVFNGGTLVTTGTYSSGSTVQPWVFGPGGGTLDVEGASLTKQGNSVSGGGTITKVGPGIFSVGSNASTFNGLVFVNEGTFQFTSNQFKQATGVTIAAGAQYQIKDDATGGTFNFAAGAILNLNGSGAAASTTPGAVALIDQSPTSTTLLGPKTTFSTAIYFQTDSLVSQFNGSGAGHVSQLTLSGAITGPGNLIKGGDGVLVLSNAANAYGGPTGTTTVNSGVLRISGGADRVPTTSTLVLADGTVAVPVVFDLNGQSQTLAGLRSSGTGANSQVINGAATGTAALIVTYNGAAPQTFAGTLGGTGANNNNFTFTKDGTGTFTLAGPNTITGTTTAAAGTLRVLPYTATAGYAVNTGATLGVVSGAGTATLTLPTLSLAAGGGTLAFELNTPTAPTTALLTVSGTDGINRNGGTQTISVSDAQPLSPGSFTLIQYTGVPITGGFAIGTLPTPRTAGNLDYSTPGQIKLTITGIDSLVWTGAVSGDWDAGTAVNVGGTQNWKLASNGNATNFVTGDRIAFDDTSAVKTINLTGAVQPAGVTVTTGSTYTFQGPGAVTGTTALTKQGTGTLVVLTNNTYSGGTTVSAGTLQVGNGGTTGAIGSGDLVNNGAVVFNRSDNVTLAGNVSGTGTLSKLGANTLTVGGAYTPTGDTALAGGTLALTNGASYTVGGAITGAGGLAKSGPGTLTLAGNNTYTGGTTVTGGGVQVGSGGTTGTLAGPVSLAASTTLSFNRSDAATFPGDVSGAGGLAQLGAGTTTLTGNLTYTGPTAVTAGTLDLNPAGAITLPGAISGTGTITKSGTGTVTQTGDSAAFTGTLVVNGGRFVSSNPVGTHNFNAVSIVVNSGGTYQFGDNTIGDPNLPNTTYITVNPGGTVDWQEGETFGGINLYGGTVALTQGGMTLNGTAPSELRSGTVTAPGAAQSIAGSGGLVKTTPGTVTFSGAASFTDPLTIQDGTVVLAAAANYGTVPITLGTATTTGTLEYQGATVTKSGAFTMPGPGVVRVTNPAAVLTLSGGFSGGGALTKDGPGTLTLSGDGSGLSGAVTVAAGTLLANHATNSLGSGAVTVGTGGTLGGTGTIAAGDVVTVQAGGTVKAGSAAGAGTLTVDGRAVGLAANAALGVRITDGSTPSSTPGGSSLPAGGLPTLTSNNFLNVTGSGTLTVDPGMKVVIDGTGATFTAGAQYSYAVAQAPTVTGLSTPITNPTQFQTVGFTATDFSLSTANGVVYLGFTAAPVPEPLTVGLVAVAGLAVGGLVRRRRRAK
jgi:autotransporter-associated beta strand protein